MRSGTAGSRKRKKKSRRKKPLGTAGAKVLQFRALRRCVCRQVRPQCREKSESNNVLRREDGSLLRSPFLGDRGRIPRRAAGAPILPGRRSTFEEVHRS